MTSLAQLWARMDPEHSQYLERARDASALTIPTLVPWEGASGSEITNPYQSLGAEGVRSLASNLVLTILPMDLPFFKLELPFEDQLEEDHRSELQIVSSRLEQRILVSLEEMQIRDKFNQACQFFLVAGLAVMDFRKDIPRVHRFENVRMQRDGRGNILCLIVREGIGLDDLPEGSAAEDLMPAMESHNEPSATRLLFTVMKLRQGGGYETWQEVHLPNDEKAWYQKPGSYKKYKKWIDGPWIVMGFDWLDGEHYPRSYLDQLISDLDTYDLLTRAMLEGTISAAQQRTLVRPGGMTDIDDILDSNNGAVIPGREDDIGSLNNRTRTADLSFAASQIPLLEARLARQFLLFLSVRREGERVTAEEIQQTALALRQGLGGSYAALATQFQLHLVQIVLRWLKKDPTAKAIFDGFKALGVEFKPRVIAGLEVLGRAEALNRQTLALNVFAQILGPEALAQIVHPRRLMDSLLAGAGSPVPSWLLSVREIQESQQAAQQQALLQTAAPELIKQAGANARGNNG